MTAPSPRPLPPPGTRPAAPPTALDLLRRAMFSRRARIGWAVALATLALVVGAKALVPHPTGPTLGWDKANHAAAFAVLAFTGLFTFRSSARPLFWVSFLLMAFGVGIEIAQLYVPGRSADLADVVADAAGIVLGLAVADTLARRLERRRHPRGPGSGGGPRG